MGDITDVVSFGPEKPPRPLLRRLAAVVGAVVLVVAVVLILREADGPYQTTSIDSPTTAGRAQASCAPVGLAQSPATTDPVAGLLIEQPGDTLRRTLTQQRCDRTALDGPWAVVVRRPEGSLARHSAVVTFPVEAPAPGRSVAVAGVTGAAGDGEITWPVAGAHARIRGDLSEVELLAIAARTTVVSRRPNVQPPAGYAVASSGPYRPPVIHEVGYGSAEVGEKAALGSGWLHLGVTSGGGFEDRLFAVGAGSGGTVHSRPAVVSGIRDGAGMLSWEPTPGVVAFVGYGDGALLDGDAVAALWRLAERTRALTSADWQAVQPITTEQINDDRHPGPWPAEARRGPGG